MQRFFIIAVNGALLILLLIGLPAATREQVGNLQLSSAAADRRLMFWILGIAIAGNLLAAFALFKERRNKIFCCEWAAIFGLLLLAYHGFVHGWFDFEWLKRALQWLQKHLSRA